MVGPQLPRFQSEFPGQHASYRLSRVNQRLDARSSASIDAVYSIFTYSGKVIINGFVQPDIETRALNASYQRLLSKSSSVGVSGGRYGSTVRMIWSFRRA